MEIRKGEVADGHPDLTPSASPSAFMLLAARRLITALPRTRTMTAALSTLAKSKAAVLANWQGTSVTGGNTKLFINGKFEESKTDKWMDVLDPVCLPRSPMRLLIVAVDTNSAYKSPGNHKRRV